METSHIRNALAMLKRQGYVGISTRSFYLSCPLPLGEAAQDAFNMEFDAVMDAPTSPFIDAFKQELERRGENRNG